MPARALLCGTHRFPCLGVAKSHLCQGENDLFAHVERWFEACSVIRRDVVLALAKVQGAFDVGTTERLLRPQAIVRTTTDPKVPGFGSASDSVGNDVIELEERGRTTVVTVQRDVGAAVPVPFEDEAAVGVGNAA